MLHNVSTHTIVPSGRLCLILQRLVSLHHSVHSEFINEKAIQVLAAIVVMLLDRRVGTLGRLFAPPKILC